jgi:NADPH:quinone reductase-like Zn-dependent oxidoreductase
MRAALYHHYGDPEILTVTEVAEPKIGPDSVVVDVHATSVNPVDWKIMAGYLDGIMDIHFPVIPGWDVAGIVSAVGPAVEEFHVGDRVFGYVRMDVVQHGSFAERIAAPVRTLALMPTVATFAQAAAAPLAGLTAYQGLVDALQLQQGETVLVTGGAGGVGTFAIQIAQAIGANVLATGSEESAEFLRSLGAQPVLSGAPELRATVDELAPSGLDALFDLYGGEDLETLIPSVNDPRRVASVATTTIKDHGGHYVFVRPDRAGLEALAALIDGHKLQPILAGIYDLDHAGEAMRASMSGHTRGKIVVTVA